jgi:tetratricopeptide (TPR) repeat protein
MHSSAQPVAETQTADAGPQAPSARNRIASARPGLMLAARACLLVVLPFSIYFAARQGVAAWYFRKSLPQDIEAAAKWDAGNPQYPSALGTLMRFYADNPSPDPIVRLCETAVRLSPNEAHYWADLGAAYDWAGRPNDALHAFEWAHDLFPNSPDINWSLANFYIRVGRPNDGLQVLQKVLTEGGIDERQVFSLATHAAPDSDVVLNEVLPARAPFLIDYLNFQSTAGNIDAAKAVWARLLESGQPFELHQAFPYFDALIHHKDLDAASQEWAELGDRFPSQIRERISPENLVTNGDFAFEVLNGGFDWRVNPVQGATVSIQQANSRGTGSLQIEFDGSRNLEYEDVLQLVPVQPRTRYQFSAQIRGRGITTDSGPRFQVFDIADMAKLFAATENLVGTSDWSTETLNFQTLPETRLLVVRFARPASSKLDNKISGTVWIRRVSLVREGQ